MAHRRLFRCAMIMGRPVLNRNGLIPAVEGTRSYSVNLERGPYSVVNESDLHFFKSVFSGEESRVVTDEDALNTASTCWLGVYAGHSSVLLRPKTTLELSSILKYCNDRNLAVVPQGGNTDLVGGSVPVFDEIILSTSLMNNVIDINPTTGVLVCQAGCIHDHLTDALCDHDLILPYDLAAKGSCQIGGNVATNAGGLRLLRYGSLHGTVLGLEAVLADGRVLDCMSTVRKDNTGYDVKQLFVGSEGSLGVISKVSILCAQKPAAVNVALFGLTDFKRVLEVYRRAKSDLGEILSAVEFLDYYTMESVKHMGLSDPLSPDNGNPFPFYMLIETSGSNSQHDTEKLQSFIDDLISNSVVSDGVIGTDLTKIQNLWKLREAASGSLLHLGKVLKFDISLPLDNYYQIVEDVRERYSDSSTCIIAYGHIGDGNLHLNISMPELRPETQKPIDDFVLSKVSEWKGSISAEHGIGQHKRDYLHLTKSLPVISLMKQLKKLMDPNNILNPYKVLPDGE